MKRVLEQFDRVIETLCGISVFFAAFGVLRRVLSVQKNEQIDGVSFLCGGNEAQLRQVVISMSQAGTMVLKTLGAKTGVKQSEHSPIDIDIRRQEDGSVTMRFHTPENSPLDADYSYAIAPDGKAVMTSFRMQARQVDG